MFRGSLPTDALSIIHEVVQGWATEDIYVACSGDFTVERDLRSTLRASLRLHSNDVTIYSSAFGLLLSGGQPPCRVRPEFKDRLGWLEEYMSDPAGAVATLALSTKLLEGFHKTKNLYYVRQTQAYMHQWPQLHAKTKTKVLNLVKVCPISSFYAGDATDWMQSIPANCGVICYPPFFPGDYEKMFERLTDVFEWDPPAYPIMTAERRELLFERVMEKNYWVFGTHQRRDGLEANLHGIAQTTNRGAPVLIYASTGEVNRIVRPRQQLESLSVPRLDPADVMGERLHLVELTSGQFASLRSQYMNIDIKPGQPTLAVGVLIDGRLLGSFALSPPKGGLNIPASGAYAYLLSDFPVAPASYEKLAKLVLYAALSKEGQALAERMLNKRVVNLTTTAFSKHHESMKYRSLFKLFNRHLEPDGRFMLNYIASYGQWSLQEGLAQWKKRFGKKGTKIEV